MEENVVWFLYHLHFSHFKIAMRKEKEYMIRRIERSDISDILCKNLCRLYIRMSQIADIFQNPIT